MSIPESTTIKCWLCKDENDIIYGGESEKGPERCNSCNAVIADRKKDLLSIADSREHAEQIKERHNEYTLVERVKRWLSWS